MQFRTTSASQRGPYEGIYDAPLDGTVGVAYAALADAARTLVGTSAAGPLGLALSQLRAAMDAVNAELVAESAAERQLAECDPNQVALAMATSGMPETFEERLLWVMGASELARPAVTDYRMARWHCWP